MGKGSLEHRGKKTWLLTVWGPDGKGRRTRHRRTVRAQTKRDADRALRSFALELDQAGPNRNLNRPDHDRASVNVPQRM